jgi:ATP-dependent DNA helicase RecQ
MINASTNQINLELKNSLKQYFGYDVLRPAQIPVIENIMNGNDTLAIMPTGGGKSLCYQLPSLLSSGLTIVISPLIALMHDQVISLMQNGITAAYLNSNQGIDEQNEVMQLLQEIKDNNRTDSENSLKLLYVSPEKLLANNNQFLTFLTGFPISYIAIDEAHCVSSWGHDFREEYSKLAVLKNFFPTTPIIALTATADELTRSDILKKLNLFSAKTFISSFDRPNIHYRVEPKTGDIKQLVDFINTWQGSTGIVYCLSRKSTEEVANKLKKAGVKAKHYHASISREDKQKAYKEFMNDEIQVIVATIAFGMGIDKPNVRFVAHWNLPKNIESYYQETGRAGRDGLPSEALLVYSAGDAGTLRQFIINGVSSNPDVDNELFQKIQHDKLDRLLEFCQTGHCRRRVLLQYFQEKVTSDCQNCDCCDTPRAKIDGTIIAQKIMSAIYRTGQKFGIGYVVDLLLGVSNPRMFKYGHEDLPTFGIGKNCSKEAWMFYTNQLINLGLVDIKYDEFIKTLELNELSMAVLEDKNKVELIEYTEPITKEKQEKKRATRGEKATSSTAKQQKDSINLDEREKELFEKLRILRRQIADEKKLAPFMVFADLSLMAMARHKPKNKSEFEMISGVGKMKLRLYAEEFLGVIN